MKSILLLTCGFLALGIGTIGMILPILPTTPFVLLAAVCFGGSSPKLYGKMEKSAYFGQFITNYKDKTGIKKQVKIKALFFLWGMLIFSAIAVQNMYLNLLFIIVGICVTIHITGIKTKTE